MYKILLIEDEKIVRDVFVDFLNYGGFDVTALENGLETDTCLTKNQYDVLITDLVLPFKSGIDIIRETRSQYNDLIIIALTGGARVTTMSPDSEAVQAGANICLLKPISGMDLITNINLFLQAKKAS